jgi:hypothetical protein
MRIRGLLHSKNVLKMAISAARHCGALDAVKNNAKSCKKKQTAQEFLPEPLAFILRQT